MEISKNIMKNVLSVILILLFIYSDIIPQNKFENKRDTIYVVISDDLVGYVERTDVLAAMELWVEEMIHEISENRPKISPMILNSTDEIKERILQNEADIIGLSALDYIKYYTKLPIEPAIVVQNSQYTGVKYILITKNDSQINSLSDLRSKKILSLADSEEEIVEKWLFVEMKKEEINNPLEIINNFIKIPKPNKRVFSVFFDNADGCVVTKSQYESMCEFNPQLSKQMRILHESPPFLTQIYCINKNSIKKEIQNSKNYVKDINRTENGSQVLQLLKIFKVVGFERNDIETIEKLFDEYNYYNGTNK